ncbi:MAG: 1-acyl-sn-glycerol-3-phosphate acyltransferase, partial [Myxococcota bacterium]
MSILKTIGSFVFSLYCWLGTLVWMMVTSLLLSPIMWLLGPDKGHRFVSYPSLGWVIPLCFIRVKKHYHPDYDPEVRGVYLQNHVSVLDGSMATYTLPHAFCGLFNSWHFRVPGYGWVMRLSKGIGVPSAKEGRSEKLSAAVRDRVRNFNISVLAFPEGHRTLDGNVGEFRRGAFFMARDAGVPVIPFVQRGMFECQNKLSMAFRPGTVDVYFGKPIETAGLDDEQIAELADHCQRIHELWVEGQKMPQL